MTVAHHETPLSSRWYELVQLIDRVIGAGKSAAEERENHELAQKYRLCLDFLRHDRSVNGVVYLGMFRAPASKDRHHDREGGLVEHLLEMWDAWQSFNAILYGTHRLSHPQLNASNALRAIIHHDLNKVWRYRLVSTEPWAVDYADTEGDRMQAMLGSVHKKLWILQHEGIELSQLLHNALITSEGGYSRDRPPTETVFAKLLYLVDEFSANVLDRLHHQRFWDSKRGGAEHEKPEV